MAEIKIVKKINTCTACPTQLDVWDEEGTYYYVRYRWGNLTVNKDAVNGPLIFEAQIGDGLDGYIEWSEICAKVGFIDETDQDI